jgi:DNA-binding transcriptional regulator YiaG
MIFHLSNNPNELNETLAFFVSVFSGEVQQVTEWKKGRNRPSAEAALVMLELLKTKLPKAQKK